MSVLGIPQPRTFSQSGLAIAGLPATVLTVPAGKTWRIWQAYVQMNMQGTAAMAVQSTLDLQLLISGGDILVAASITLINPSSGEFTYANLDQGGRPLPAGTVIQLRTAFGLPANTVARVCGGCLISQA